MSSENHSEAFYSADEDLNMNSRSSSLRNSILSSGDTPLTRQDSNSAPTQRFLYRILNNRKIQNNLLSFRKKFSSELNILIDKNCTATLHKNPILTQAQVQEAHKLKLSSHRSDHEIHTPEHRSFSISEQVSDM